MKVLSGIIATLVVIVAAGLAVIYSGVYNVAATNVHTGILEWVLHTTMTQSVKRRAAEVAAPPANREALVPKGARRYGEMCAQCHGAPGVAADETGKGLMPPAPDLAKTAAAWSERELYWIIKNGVQFTGMPAWGETHDDAELWELALFVKTMPNLTAEQYRALSGKEVRRLHEHTH